MALTFGKGLRRSAPEKIEKRDHAVMHPRIEATLRASVRANSPGSADLTEFAPPVGDQGDTSCCWAFSASTCLYTARGAAGKPMAYVPSQLYFAKRLYSWYRNQSALPDATLPPLRDQGAELADAAAVFARCGDVPMGAPVEGRFSDVPSDSDGPFPQLTVEEAERGSEDCFGGEYQIPVDNDAPAFVAASLSAGIPVWVGTLVGRAFEQLGPNDIAQPCPEGEAGSGGHALAILGFRTLASGERQFLVRNSWSDAWAAGGNCWASSDWIRSCWEIFPFAVKEAA